MSPPTAILAEDEKVLRDELRQRLGELWPELIVVGEAGTGIEALQLLEKQMPDLMFLDIQMPGLTGLEVAHQAQGRCHIVFVTAYDAYAVAAFETGALDYVLKPLERERLRLAVDRVRQRLGSAPQNIEVLLRDLIRNAEPRKYLRWINASVGHLMQLITVDEVVYFQADAKYTRVVTATCEALIKKPLNELRNELDPSVFWQVHRSTIVNANAIAGVSRDMLGHINLKLKRRDEKLNVSESHAHLFRQM
ncbi:MAG TPA: LytTR family DNA-binding domain-containing protein [Steroidobacteraceae bacterium]|nr:LytTR family DNA-binding domain-containing protein [Steroidobacteraceae bacterium]